MQGLKSNHICKRVPSSRPVWDIQWNVHTLQHSLHLAVCTQKCMNPVIYNRHFTEPFPRNPQFHTNKYTESMAINIHLKHSSPGYQTYNIRCNLCEKMNPPIGKTPVRIILWCLRTKMLIKACFLTQPLEQEGGCLKCCISLCSKVFMNHFYQMKESPECLYILIYWSTYLVDRLRKTLRRKV